VLEIFLAEYTDRLELKVGPKELAILAASTQLVSVLGCGRLRLDSSDVCNVGLGQLLLSFEGFEVEGAMIKTLIECIFTHLGPAALEALPLLEQGLVV
jgi:hypothetical protein